MQAATVTTQSIIEQIKGLPPESLDDLASYVDYLNYRTRRVEPVERPLDIVKLGGLLEGYDVDVSPEKLAETRREMWRKHKDTGL
jgi:hypothetical protein